MIEDITQYIPFIDRGSDNTGREPPDVEEPEPGEDPEYNGLDPR